MGAAHAHQAAEKVEIQRMRRRKQTENGNPNNCMVGTVSRAARKTVPHANVVTKEFGNGRRMVCAGNDATIAPGRSDANWRQTRTPSGGKRPGIKVDPEKKTDGN